MDIEKELDEILYSVQEPAAYIGGEVNAIRKDWAAVDFKMLLAFPEVYSIGMSHLGSKIVYHVVNSRADSLCERAFAPRADMEARMREKGIPLYSLESFRAARDFDVVGFSLQYELTFTNVLTMLDLAGIPLLASERKDGPLVVAGGPAAMNPEPMADFIDIFFIGEAEETLGVFIDELKKVKGKPRAEVIAHLAKTVPGLYAPAGYSPVYNDDGTLKEMKAADGFPKAIKRAFVKDLDAAPFPTAPVVPYVETVHDRVALEIMRGCPNGCRFCQAGVIYRPVRQRSVGKLLEIAEASLKSTGFDEVSLLSLSTSDYSAFNELVARCNAAFSSRGVGLSLPSLRVDSQLDDAVQAIAEVRKSGLTIAVEAASERLRKVVNKTATDEGLFRNLEAAFRQGWQRVKFYFMLCLPTETDDEAAAIGPLLERASAFRKNFAKGPAFVTAAFNAFIPKSHTPFQWEKMSSLDEIRQRQGIIKGSIRSRRVAFKFHPAEMSVLEGAFARGDRREGAVILAAWRAGAKFDGWSEHFNFERWLEAFKAAGLSLEFYLRERNEAELLPWDHITSSVAKEFLLKERGKAFGGGEREK